MQGLTFITQSDGASGKVASPKARSVIRAHVMRKHWTDKGGARRSRSEPSKTASIETVDEQAEEASASADHAVATSDITCSSQSACNRTSNKISSRPNASRSTSLDELSLSRRLNRVTDGFVYGGCSIDVKSYGLFHHYSRECTVASTVPSYSYKY